MAERARIAQYFLPLSKAESGSFNLSDDAAVLAPPAGYSLVFTTDSVIENIHVLDKATPQQFAQKLVRRNLSDLAAMGAKPWRYLLNLHTPSPPYFPPASGWDDWFAAFAEALAREQNEFSMLLIGGDSTSGGNSIHTTLTCIGLMQGAPLLRSGAAIGDDIYVSGTIGDAALGLMIAQRKLAAGNADSEFLTTQYHVPQPRLALGQALRGIATACIDISDGLFADAAQIATASRVGMHIMREAIPLSNAARNVIAQHNALAEIVIGGGDDYELLFTASPSVSDKITALARSLDLPLTCIGNVVAGTGVQLFDMEGKPAPISTSGWEYA